MTFGQFHIPVLPDVLPRPRLYRMLSSCRHCRIILLTGQAAQGKSTLAADYLNREKAPCLWFHMNPSFKDSGSLFDLIFRGLETLFNPCPQGPSFPHVSLGTRQDLPRQSEILARAMNRIESPLNLVLDDMEALAPDSPSLELVQALLAESPRRVRFFLLSRTRPGLNLSRFEMNQELLMLGNRDLAFTLEETQAFFTGTALPDSAPLDPKDAQKILAATGGWAGGLILVAEAVRQTRDFKKFPQQISAKAFAYFSQEIYRNLTPDIREFLRQTALFEVLDTRMLSLIFPGTNPVELLNRMEQRNLFIQKVTPRSPWPVFRYNNLFREFLLTDLHQTRGKEEINALNQRIGQAFWEEKAHEQAICFFMAAGCHDQAARILKVKGADYVITGRTDRLSQWIDALPAPLTRDDPWLILFRTMAARIRGGKKNIQAFARALDLFRQQDDTRGILLSLAYLIEASVFIRQPSTDLLAYIRAGETALDNLGGEHRFAWARILLWQQIGLGYIAGTGHIPKGISACRNAILLARDIKNPDLVLNASVILTLGLVQSGDFAAARQMLEKTRAISQEGSQPEYRALENITDIDLALKRGDTSLAGELLDRSEADIEKFGLIFLYPELVEARALYHACSGRLGQAVQAADHLSDFSILAGNDFYQGISSRIKAAAFLLNGDLKAACAKAQKAVQELVRARRGDIHIFQARQIYGMALYGLGNIPAARRELEPAGDYFKQIHSNLSVCETAFVLGAALYDSGDDALRQTAARHFEQGVERALENRYGHFPLLDARLMASVLVKAWDILDDPENRLMPFIKGLKMPQTLTQVRGMLSKSHGKKTGKTAERFAPLFRAACPELFISTLGPFSILQGGRPLPASGFGGPKPLMLLKVLLLKGGTDVPKEVLMDALWPGTGEDAGEKNLKINLHRLRKALEPFAVKPFGHVYLSRKAGRISLTPDLVTVDTARFTSLARRGRTLEAGGDEDGALACYEKAVQLYKGEYFRDDPYLEETVPDREMYQRACIDILGRSAWLYLAREHWPRAVAAWQRILQIDACHEGACQNLMILYQDAGMKTEALQVYARCCKALETELDTEPDQRTREIYNRLA